MSDEQLNIFVGDDLTIALEELERAREHGAHWRCQPGYINVCSFVEAPIPKDTPLAFGQHCRRCVIALMVMCRNDEGMRHFLMRSITGEDTVQMRGYVESLWWFGETHGWA